VSVDVIVICIGVKVIDKLVINSLVEARRSGICHCSSSEVYCTTGV
jgi:hypothetical protein